MPYHRIKIAYKKLGREKIWGHADEYPLIVDERVKGKKKLEIILHESLHRLYPNASEEEVEKNSIILTHTLWHEGFREVDNSNDEPLQDGSL